MAFQVAPSYGKVVPHRIVQTPLRFDLSKEEMKSGERLGISELDDVPPNFGKHRQGSLRPTVFGESEH